MGVDARELRLLRTLADWVQVELVTENELHRAALLQRALRPRSVIRWSGLDPLLVHPEGRTDRLLGRLRDDGPPLPESERPMPGTDSENERGLAIARVALDDLVYQRVDGHNEWTMVRHRR